MKQDKQAGGLAGIYQATSRGFGFLVPEDGGGGQGRLVHSAPGGGRRVARRPGAGPAGGRGREEAGGAPPGLPPWWSGPTRRSPACWSGTTGGCGSGRTVTGCPAPSRCSPSVRSAGRGPGRRGHDQLRKRQAPAHGYPAEVFGPAGDRASAPWPPCCTSTIDREFPDAVMLEAKAAPGGGESAVAGRLDLRDKVMITIDGASSKDLDDAVSLERDGLGRWVLGVHIADVSHYVRPAPPWIWRPGSGDLGGLCRPGGAHAARELSNGICSSTPGGPRSVYVS